MTPMTVRQNPTHQDVARDPHDSAVEPRVEHVHVAQEGTDGIAAGEGLEPVGGQREVAAHVERGERDVPLHGRA